MFLCHTWNIVLLSVIIIDNGCQAVSVITANNNDVNINWEDAVENSVITADEIDWMKHPCRRNCNDISNGMPVKSMVCHYSFRVESYRTMSKACYNCPFNITDCYRIHCIPADGLSRTVQVINRQLPGPSIQVCEGDRIIVDVMNLMLAETTTMHWHGQHNRATPYMDGVPYVTQCPIMPGATFRYDYEAATVGTHFWHSHSGFQRGDGVFGSLIVRTQSSKDPHDKIYDIDEHVVIITDWDHEIGSDKFLAHHHSNGGNKARNILVNGLGRYRPMIDDTGNVGEMPVTIFSVDKGLRYRFRLINAGFLNCPIEISIDNHTMSIISTDGNDIKPIKAKYLVSYAGERFDFIVEMNQMVENYWIRFRGLMDCDERFFSAYQVAILRYNGADIDNEPNITVTYNRPESDIDEFNTTETIINALNEGTEAMQTNSISMPLLESLEPDDDANLREPNYQFYLSYDFYDKDNPIFHRKNHYGFHQVNHQNLRLFTPQLNHISMKLPSFPLLSQRDSITSNQFCNSSTVKGCKESFCACTHVLNVKLDSIVEIILVDEGVTYDANHPFHLHGHDFRVIAMARIDKNVTVEKVKELDELGLIKRNLTHAPIKDTVTVPDGGYTIIRFHANNPGYWLFHCHIEFHVEVGMALIFKVGEHSEFLPVPRKFPRCGDWRPSISINNNNNNIDNTSNNDDNINNELEVHLKSTTNHPKDNKNLNDVNEKWYENVILNNKTSTAPTFLFGITSGTSQTSNHVILLNISILISLIKVY